jgi:hypothetical protein
VQRRAGVREAETTPRGYRRPRGTSGPANGGIRDRASVSTVFPPRGRDLSAEGGDFGLAVSESRACGSGPAPPVLSALGQVGRALGLTLELSLELLGFGLPAIPALAEGPGPRAGSALELRSLGGGRGLGIRDGGVHAEAPGGGQKEAGSLRRNRSAHMSEGEIRMSSATFRQPSLALPRGYWPGLGTALPAPANWRGRGRSGTIVGSAPAREIPERHAQTRPTDEKGPSRPWPSTFATAAAT